MGQTQTFVVCTKLVHVRLDAFERNEPLLDCGDLRADLTRLVVQIDATSLGQKRMHATDERAQVGATAHNSRVRLHRTRSRMRRRNDTRMLWSA